MKYIRFLFKIIITILFTPMLLVWIMIDIAMNRHQTIELLEDIWLS